MYHSTRCEATQFCRCVSCSPYEFRITLGPTYNVEGKVCNGDVNDVCLCGNALA